jgi:hypothetical protein
LIQWIDDDIKVVHEDVSAYIALDVVIIDWQHGSAQCLSWKDLSSYDFLRITKDGFILVSVQPTSEARLRDVVFQ